MSYTEILGDDSKYALITAGNISYDSGKTWKETKTVDSISFSELFAGEKITDGASWSYANELKSGRYIEYCSMKKNGKWVSLRQKNNMPKHIN